MKVAVLASSYVPSNAANSIQVMKVCQAMKQAGAEIQLWVPSMPNTGSKEGKDWQQLTSFYGIKETFPIVWVEENLRLKRYDLAWKAMREIRIWGAEVVYTWMAQAAYLSLLNGFPTALELHMMPSGKLGPWLLKQVTQTKGKKLFLPITNALREKLAVVHGLVLKEEEIQIAPMGSEPERYKNLPDSAACREKLGLRNQFTAAYTGHLYPGRGMDLLAALAQTFPQVQFLWIGGREEDVVHWRKQIEIDGITNIHLTGFVKNALLPMYQAAADVLLMPYGKSVGISGIGDTSDVCSPMKLFDYLSTGRAILSSDLPVIHEVLNEKNAIFALPDDIDSWKEGLKRLRMDDALRQKLANAAKDSAERYSWLRRAQATLDYFNNTEI